MAAGVEWDYLDTIRTALLYNPVAGALAVVWLIGAYAVVFGILLLVSASSCAGWSARCLTRYRLSPEAKERMSRVKVCRSLMEITAAEVDHGE